MTAGEVQFAGVRLSGAWVRGGVERRVDIRVHGALTVHIFKCEEGDWRDGYSLVAQGERVIKLIGDGLLGVAEGLGQADVGRFDIGDGAVESRDGFGIRRQTGAEGICLGCRGGSSCLRALCGLLGRCKSRVLIGVLPFESVDLGLLALHLLAQLPDLPFYRSLDRRLLGSRLPGGRWLFGRGHLRR